MRISVLFLLIAALSGCTNNNPSSKEADKLIIHDTVFITTGYDDDRQKGFGLTHDPKLDSIWNKPEDFYLNDKECSGLAVDFYYGYLRPSDNGTTVELLKLATTDNQKLRPFYRWCLNKTIEISDGALGELIGKPARQYAEKFPEEFFEYLDIDSTGTKYLTWTNAIYYSGYYDDEDSLLMKKRIISTMLRNSKIKDKKLVLRIKRFGADCITYKP
jgi:hypothetical protein